MNRRTDIEPLEFDDLTDSAQGAKVPRCGACGKPGPVDLVGTWGRHRGRFPLCAHCFFAKNPPDPLQVEGPAR